MAGDSITATMSCISIRNGLLSSVASQDELRAKVMQASVSISKLKPVRELSLIRSSEVPSAVTTALVKQRSEREKMDRFFNFRKNYKDRLQAAVDASKESRDFSGYLDR